MHADPPLAATAASTAAPAPCSVRRIVRALLVALSLTAMLGLSIVIWRLAAGDSLEHALKSTSVLTARKLLMPAGNDSWAPMVVAASHFREGREGSVYERAVADWQCKFQYPPASLFLMDLLDAPEGPSTPCNPAKAANESLDADHWPIKPALDLALLVGVLLTIVLSAKLLLEAMQGRWAMRTGAAQAPTALQSERGDTLRLGLCALACGLSFYPLVQGYALGQVQVFLNLCMAAALLCLLRSSSATAGVLLGLCCLMKPQYALLVLWGVARRDWRFAAAFAFVAAAGHLGAIAHYGWAAHLHYVEFLQKIARVGEVFWANQTFNGWLNRLIGPDDPTLWSYDSFATYHPWVRWGTLLSSAALIAAGLWRRAADRDDPLRHALDLGVMLAAVTIASPIGWEHHYGGFLPLFALALGAMVRLGRTSASALAGLALAYLLVANELIRPDLWFANPWSGMLASHLWFGALLLFGQLLWLRRVPRPAGETATARPAVQDRPVGFGVS